MKVLEYIQSESDRQGATLDETINMVEAWKYTNRFVRFPNLSTIKYLCYLITGHNDYRQMPAVFDQGREAVKPELISNSMNGWHEWAEVSLRSPTETDLIIKEFLDIHPFADGNGRVASLLYNYARGTLEDPIPLPYYYGKE